MIARLVYVACDRCGDPAGDTEDLREDFVSARLRAKELGFVRVRIDGVPRDMCPDCAKAVRG